MRSKRNSAARNEIKTGQALEYSVLRGALRYPGLTSKTREIRELAEDLPKMLAVFNYKRETPCLWVVFLGGTGTGKSTLFNALCGEELSETGVERPKTSGPIAYAHEGCAIEKEFPFPSVHIDRNPLKGILSPQNAGKPGHLTVFEHMRERLSHLLFVDTPDLDSVEPANRQIAQDFYLLSDAVVFVTSQEKYADEVPYRFLLRVLKEGKVLFLLVNKAGEDIRMEEVLGILEAQGVSLGMDRTWLIPYVPSHPSASLSGHPSFRDFSHALSERLPPRDLEKHRAAQNARLAGELRSRIGRLMELLQEENEAAQKWLVALEALYRKTSGDLLEEEKELFAAKSRQYLRTEIRRLFTRYDLLAGPRRFIKEAVLTPFRFLGLLGQMKGKDHQQALLKIGRRIDLTPVQTAVEKFNLSVLEKLSPADETSPLFKKLRQPDVALGADEIRDRIWEEQDQLAKWLEERFERLSRDIPRGRKWGIYSTSILWGILLISFETVVGGGFSMLDAALDSALAPFVTKGAVELFAYHEIQKVAGELSRRYQEGLLSVLRHQRDRYARCLEALITNPQTMESLRALRLDAGDTKAWPK